jgi:hypothetical protein
MDGAFSKVFSNVFSRPGSATDVRSVCLLIDLEISSSKEGVA